MCKDPEVGYLQGMGSRSVWPEDSKPVQGWHELRSDKMTVPHHAGYYRPYIGLDLGIGLETREATEGL